MQEVTKCLPYLSLILSAANGMVIAHRMRTVAGANKILVLSDGGVAEQGTPAELMKNGGVFANMVRLQT